MDQPTATPTTPCQAQERGWSALFDALVLASTPRILTLGILGILLSFGGSSLIERTIGLPEALRSGSLSADASPFQGSLVETATAHLLSGIEPLGKVLRPITVVTSPTASFPERIKALLLGLWLLFVWNWFGGAIARVAVEKFCLDRRSGVLTAARGGLPRGLSALAAVVAPLVLIGILLIPGKVIGLLTRIPTVGPAIGSGLAIVTFLFAGLAAYVLIKTIAAWPLMVLTITTGEDAFEALSRSFSYVSSRAVHILGLFGLWAALSAVGCFLARVVAEIVMKLADLSHIVVGANPPRTNAVFQALVSLFLAAWPFAFFWCWASLVYLLLRRSVDGVPLRSLPLPESTTDAKAPTFHEAPAEEPAKE